MKRKPKAKVKLTGREFWFLCTLKFTCPECGQESTEKIVTCATKPEPSPIADRVSKERLTCQQCSRPLTKAVPVNFNISPTTLSEVKASGLSLEGV